MKKNLTLAITLALTALTCASDSPSVITNSVMITNNATLWDTTRYLDISTSVSFYGVEITSDGEVKLSKPPKEAAKVFWDAVSRLGKWDSAFTTNKAEILAIVQHVAGMQKQDEAFSINAVFVGSADRLRAEADKMDQQDRLIEKARKLLTVLKSNE